MITRAAAVAGLFYPGTAVELKAAVQRFLQQGSLGTTPAPKALIVPHAGYQYSGPIAGSGYRLLEPVRDIITRVVLLGPSHRVSFAGLALPNAQVFATPLGKIQIDQEAVREIQDMPQVVVLDSAHAAEHSLEVQLPFLQQSLTKFELVPLSVGGAGVHDVAEVLERLWGGPETLVVVSSDLSHYLDYDSARALDRKTAAVIEALEPGGVGERQACGRIPIAGLLLAARRHVLRAVTLDLRNSGDTAGTRDSVVGYGAFAFVA